MAIDGKANVRLLPTPVLSFTDIRIGEENAPDVEMERFRAEVELAPLLKGEVRIIQMSVERPRFRVDLAGLADPQPSGAAGWRLDAEKISLARLEINDGSALVEDSRAGRSWQVEGIDAVVEAGSLRGPGRISADLTFEGTPLTVRAGLGRFNPDDSVAANITVGSPAYPVTLAIDGALSLADGAPPQYAGTATIAGIEPEEDEPRSPWADFRTAGKFELTPSALVVEEAQISYGAMERPLVLGASGRLDFEPELRYDLTIDARQIDVDRALGSGPENPAGVEASFAALLAAIPNLPRPPIPGILHLDAQGVVIGGSVIQAVGIDLVAVAEGWRIESLAAMLPGDTRIDLDGTVSTIAGTGFHGHGRMASARPAALAAWWRGRVGSAGALDRFSIEADLDLGPDIQNVTKLVAATGRGKLAGSVEMRTLSGQRFIDVELRAERADLAESRTLTELFFGDLMQPGAIDQMTLSLRADVLSAGGIEARSVVLDGGIEGGRLVLRSFSVADLAGASIDARGSIADPLGVPSGRLDASVSAANIAGAADFLAGVLPENRVVAHLREAAPLLSPMTAEISAEAGGAGDSLSLVLSGSFGDTHLNITADGVGSLRAPESLTGSGSLHADGDSAKVLAQLGLDPLPVNAGPLRLDAEFEGTPSDGKLDLEAAVAGVTLTYAGRSQIRDGGITLAGDVVAESADIDPALLLAGFAVPGVGEGHAASAAGRLEYAGGKLTLALNEASFEGEPVKGSVQATFGDPTRLAGSLDIQNVSLPLLASAATGSVPGAEGGAWSDAPFSVAVPPGVALDVTINAGVLDLGLAPPASNAALHFGLSEGAINIDLARADFAGGKLKGAIAGAIREGEVELAVRGALQAGQLQALVWEKAGLPVASGLIDGSFDVKGRGRSMAGLVSTLIGSGSFAISDGRINALNPEALTAVMAAADGEGQPDEQLARETFAIQFGSGALSFGRAEGSFSVSGGVANVSTVSVSAENTTILADATFDLNDFTLASDWWIRASEAGTPEASQPQVKILFTGPIGRPERQVDLNPLLNLLRSNYLQRQLDELEELEEARRQAEARRRRLDAEQPGVPSQGPSPDSEPPEANLVIPGEVLPAPLPAVPDGPPTDLLPKQGATDPLVQPGLLAPI